jgi:hypothetical protein
MTEESRHCQYVYGDLLKATYPDDRLALRLRRYWWNLKRLVWYISNSDLRASVWRVLCFVKVGRPAYGERREAAFHGASEALGLKAGDLIEVRSAKEIVATLDEHGKLKGLGFTAEMMKFCGRRFRVYKRLDKIILEATGELRKIKSPTVLLEGVFCDGSAHGGCDRSCLCFWREAWLKQVPSDPHEMK